MARQLVFWILLSACWQSVQSGLLEQAIDTVQKTIFPDQKAGNSFANIPAFRSSKVRTINGSADDPTSMHFRNQDFSIVLGKDGLKTIDSILDRVFNLTTKLQMQKGKSFNVTTTNENTPRYNEDPETSTPPQFLETTNDFQPSDALITAPFEDRNKFFISSEEKHEPTNSQLFQEEVRGTSGSLKSLIRKRPILTDRDAPHYFDPVDGLLKANDKFNKFDDENFTTAKSSKKTYPGNSPSFASEQKLSTQNIGKQVIEKEQDVPPEGNQNRTAPGTQLHENDISPDRLTDDGQNGLVNDG